MKKARGILAFFVMILLIYGIFTYAAIGGVLPVFAEEATGELKSGGETDSSTDPTPDPEPTPNPEPEPSYDPEPSYYSSDSYSDSPATYYDPTAQESIVMVYPSGVTPSSSGSSSETSSSQSVAGTTAKSSSSAPPTSQNHTGRNLIFIGIALFVLSAAGIGTFLYLMFILPYLRKKRFLQNPQLAYAGAGAAAASTTRDLVSSSSQPALQDAPEDVYYEDDYGNRYRREELPGYSDTELPQNHSYDRCV